MNYREMLLEELEDDLYDDYDYDYDDYYDEDYLLEGLNDKDKYKAYVKKCRQNGKRPKSYEKWANTRAGLATAGAVAGTAAIGTGVILGGRKHIQNTERNRTKVAKYELGKRYDAVEANASQKAKIAGMKQGKDYAYGRNAKIDADAEINAINAGKAAELAKINAKGSNRSKTEQDRRAKSHYGQDGLDAWLQSREPYQHREDFDPFLKDFGVSFLELCQEGFDSNFLLYEDVDTVANAIDIYYNYYC